jgi:hypothetical protein
MSDQLLEEFTERLRSAHGENLVSAILYGADERAETRAAAARRVLVVLDRITPPDLRAAHDAYADWTAAGNPPPVYFTAAEVADASDVFPIEFLDMTDNHRVLAGRDVLDGLAVSTRNLRHQVEYELRGKLIRLRRLYIPSSDSAARLSKLLAESLGTFAKLFRFALLLVGADAPTSEREVIRAAVARFELDAATFDKILSTLESGKAMQEAEAHECFGAYIEQVERVIEAVDKAPQPETHF